jgi:predicted flavoprotein YhiN
MVTRYGLEGGAIYALAPALRAAIEAGGPAVLEIDLRPDESVSRLTGCLGARPRKPGETASTYLRKAAHLSAAEIGLMREAHGVDLPIVPGALARMIKTVPVPLLAMQPLARAISAAGGLRFDALDGLMVQGHPGVFAAGEMLDWEAPTGGYLLQAAFATGAAAAAQALAWLNGPPIPPES